MGKRSGNRGAAVDVGTLPDFVRTYAGDRAIEITRKIAPLVAGRDRVSPLFVRFAIEQALAGEELSASAPQLVSRYVEALRKGRLDLGADDMIRAASAVAVEAVRERLVPTEMSPDFLRATLIKEGDELPFMNDAQNAKVDPAAMTEMQVASGLLNRNRSNRMLQFAYDPVAEHLAAAMLAQNPTREGFAELLKRIKQKPDIGLAHALAAASPVLEGNRKRKASAKPRTRAAVGAAE